MNYWCAPIFDGHLSFFVVVQTGLCNQICKGRSYYHGEDFCPSRVLFYLIAADAENTYDCKVVS